MADDQLSAEMAEIRQRSRDAVNAVNTGVLDTVRAERSIYRRTAKDVPRLLAALEAVLAEHAPAAYVACTEPCTAHLSDINGRRDCPDCRKVERTGCRRCRDENGNPARPEDCRERAIITRALLAARARNIS